MELAQCAPIGQSEQPQHPRHNNGQRARPPEQPREHPQWGTRILNSNGLVHWQRERRLWGGRRAAARGHRGGCRHVTLLALEWTWGLPPQILDYLGLTAEGELDRTVLGMRLASVLFLYSFDLRCHRTLEGRILNLSRAAFVKPSTANFELLKGSYCRWELSGLGLGDSWEIPKKDW